jgi:hypothetical protein
LSLATLAALLLASLLSTFPHGHWAERLFGCLSLQPESHDRARLSTDPVDEIGLRASHCAICSFTRLISHGQISAAPSLDLSLPEARICAPSEELTSVRHARPAEPRGPPAA